MDRTAKKNFIIDTLYLGLILALSFSALYAVFKFLLPFVIGSIIGFLVQKPSRLLSEKIKIKSKALAPILSVLVFLILGSFFCFLVYRLAIFLLSLTDFLPDLIAKIGLAFNEIKDKYASLLPENLTINVDSLINNTLEKALNFVVKIISNFASSIAKGMPKFFITSIVTLVATCYISKDFEALKRFLKSVVGVNRSDKIVRIKNIFLKSVLRLIKGYLILSFITFLELYLGLSVLRVQNALSIALFIAFADLLPVIGTGTVIVPWAVISSLLGDYYFAVSLAVLFLITAIVRNFLEPKIIGRQIGVSSLFTLASMFLGLKLLGLFGLILFPIIFIVVITYYKDEMNEELSQ